MEDLDANDTLVLVEIHFLQIMAAFTHGMIALFGVVIFSINNL